LTQAQSEAGQFALPLLDSVLNKAEVANLLSVPVTWVATHSNLIPGAFRLGRNLRFRRAVIEEWLCGSSPLLKPEEVSQILRVNTSWVYAHADQIPGVTRLGYYIRFKPSMLLAFLNETGACQ
jgi:predicted DNA-binding transcriptional regulator AlpA